MVKLEVLKLFRVLFHSLHGLLDELICGGSRGFSSPLGSAFIVKDKDSPMDFPSGPSKAHMIDPSGIIG